MSMTESNVFRIRAYGRTELACMYYPKLTPHAAWKKLKALMEGCRGLMARLKELEYDGSRRSFTPAEVRAIVAFLDEP